MKKIEESYEQSLNAFKYSQEYADYLIDILQHLDHRMIGEIIKVFEEAQTAKKRIYFAGNGGSASTCGHFVNDLTALARKNKGGELRVIDLTSNLATITALANDIGYSDIFIGQIENIISPDDIFVVISASGNSANLVKAVRYARSKGTKVIGFLGFDGGVLKDLCDLAMVIKTPQGQYGPVEDVHLILNHLISSYLSLKHSHEKVSVRFPDK